jgi:hypothetical protein
MAKKQLYILEDVYQSRYPTTPKQIKKSYIQNIIEGFSIIEVKYI